MDFIRYIVLPFVALSLLSDISAAETPDSVKPFTYKPSFRGVVRGRYELETRNMENRFQLRNARMYIEGYVAPIVDYKVECDYNQGDFKIIYAWGRVALSDNFKVTLGQMRYPFSVTASYSPFNYTFNNRSFIGKQVGNYTGVGLKLAYSHPVLPLNIEGGIFNHYRSNRQQVWQKQMDYAAKINYRTGNVRFQAGMESIIPDSVRINMFEASVRWQSGRWTLEGEYLVKDYTGDKFETTNSYVVWGDYSMPVKAGVFNRLSFQGRWDGMSDNSDGMQDDDGELTVNNPACDRITVGSTLSCINSRFRTDIRLNYEKYFYRNNVPAPVGGGDKLSAELVIIF